MSYQIGKNNLNPLLDKGNAKVLKILDNKKKNSDFL